MRHVPLSEATLATLDRGVGPPVLFVHGFPLDHTMWNAQVEAVETRFRAIAPDLRGFGLSVATADTATIDQYADDLAALLDGLGVTEPVVLCGLSMGGYIAFAFVRRHRRRLRGLVLCDTRAAPDAPDAAVNRLQTADRVLREGAAFLADTMLPRLLSPATLAARPEIGDALRDVMVACDPRGVAAAQRAMAARVDSTTLLPQIDVPTLVLVGEHDALSTVNEMRAMAEKIPSARFVVVPAAGHMAPVENPPVANEALLGFLDGLK